MTSAKLVTAFIGVSLLAGCASNPIGASACREPNLGLAAVGTLAGGLVGSQIGAGLGRQLAIAAGAGTGAVLGSRTHCD
jgi:outer membrane lipoprotein SlyB